MDNQFHLNSNQRAGTQGGHCDAASCGARGPNECVNQASNMATNSGDYLRIEGAGADTSILRRMCGSYCAIIKMHLTNNYCK